MKEARREFRLERSLEREKSFEIYRYRRERVNSWRERERRKRRERRHRGLSRDCNVE